MSLYLTIFDGPTEVDGWVLGHYSDFGYFRDAVAERCPNDELPVLLGHSDCDGEWSVADLPSLRAELLAVEACFKRLPAEAITGAFEHNRELIADAASLADCFHNVDGEPLFEALLLLLERAESLGLPILFQ